MAIVIIDLDTGAPFLTPDEQLLLDLTNAARADHGLPALWPDGRLQALARWKASELARLNLLSHTLPDGTDLAEHLRLFGLAGAYASENASVAEHWLGATARANHSKLVESPLHLANLLQPEMTHAGMASALGLSGLYSVEVFAALQRE